MSLRSNSHRVLAGLTVYDHRCATPEVRSREFAGSGGTTKFVLLDIPNSVAVAAGSAAKAYCLSKAADSNDLTSNLAQTLLLKLKAQRQWKNIAKMKVQPTMFMKIKDRPGKNTIFVKSK